MKKIVTLALLMSAALVSPANAGTTVFTGNTTGAPTYNRPLAGTPPTVLSAVGTAVRYVVTPFTVSVSGNYNFFNATAYDSYLGIHRNAFTPANGLLNAIAYNDDFNGTLDGGFSNLALLAGVSYFAISTGFDSPDFGAFSLTVSGPGNIVGGGVGGGGGVPEPATWAMLIFGFAGIGAALRRRRLPNVTVTA
jgi:PEP-CTERM motif